MANEALIQGAAKAYGAGIGNAAAMRQANISRQQPNFGAAAAQAAMQAQAQKRYKKAQNDQTVRGYIDSIPADFDVSQIPQKYRGAISTKLQELKINAAQAARDIVHFQPGEEGYQARVDIINQSKNAMMNMKKQFDAFGKEKKSFLEDYSSKNFSAANDPEGTMSRNASLYTDQLDVEIGDDGNLFFSGEGVESFNLNISQQDQPFNKAFGEAKDFLTKNKSIYNAGRELSNADITMHRNDIANTLDKGGWEVTQSFLYDDLFGKNPIAKQGLSVSGFNSLDEAVAAANSKDPAIYVDAREAINEALEDHLIGNLKTVAKQGKDAKNPENVGDDFTFVDDNSLDVYGETITEPAVIEDGIEVRPAIEYVAYPTIEHKTSTNKELRLQNNRYIVYDTSTRRAQSSIALSAGQTEINKFLKRHFKV